MSKNSPVKSLSVRDGKDGKRSLHVKRGEKSYKSVANFYFNIFGFVEFPLEFQRINGYLLDVIRSSDGVSMRCFVTCEEMDNTKAVRNAINRTFSAQGGVFWQGIKDSQLNEYWLQVLEEYLSRPKELQNRKRAALTLGRHLLQDDQEVYILTGQIQLDTYGVLIPEEQQDMIWMVPYLNGVPVSISEKTRLKEYLKISPLSLNLPLQPFDWTGFIRATKDFMGANFFQFIMLLSGGLSAFHYQKVLAVVGSCPAPMAVGATASGKSTSLQLIQKLLGGTLLSQSSGESVMTELMKSTFPVYWDDPTHPNTLKKVLVSTFQGGGKQTKGGGNEVPLTTFLMTVNFTLDDDMRSFERTTPIPFEKIVTRSGKSYDTFMEEKKNVFDIASLFCLPSVIRMGNGLTERNLQEHVKFFRDKLVGLPSRLPSIYSCFRYFANEVIAHVTDLSVISKEEIDQHLTEVLIPYVTRQYEKTRKVHATLHQLIADLISAVERTNEKKKVQEWLKPCVRLRISAQGSAIHILKSELSLILSKAGTPYSANNFAQVCSEVDGASADFRSDFGNGHREISIKIPRAAVNEEQLKQIDSWFAIAIEDDDESRSDSIADEDIQEKEGCCNCQELADEIAIKTAQWREQESALLKAHEKAVSALQDRLREEHKRRTETEEELTNAREIIADLQEEIVDMRQGTCTLPPKEGSAVTQALMNLSKDQGDNHKALQESGFTEESDAEDQVMDVTPTASSTPLSSKPRKTNSATVGKRKANSQASLDLCNLCSSKKQSGMIKCNSCGQWQHSRCAKINLKEYIDKIYSCSACEDGQLQS